MAQKINLTPEERIQVAFGHYVLGIEQDTLASLFGTNGGRVNEACKAIRLAAENPKKARPNYGKMKS